jgi:hypothetical protein
MQDTTKQRGGFLVRQILGPTVTLDGVELGPLDGKTQLAIAAKVIGRSTGERLGARYRTLTSHHDLESRATILTWVFDKSAFGSIDEAASLGILQDAIEAWAAETSLRLEGAEEPVEEAERPLRDGLGKILRFRSP